MAADAPDADPHGDQPVVTAGAPAGAAEVAAVLLHGRGATAQGVVNLADPFYRHGVAFLAPQAARSRWFPRSFLAPVERNEPHLSSALGRVEAAVAAARRLGVPLDRTVLFGFSQGACLAAEYAARDARRYGGLVVLRGGLVGETVDRARYEGSFAGTPAHVGAGGADERVPVERVRETAAVLRERGADVTERVHEGVGHGVTDAELATVASLVEELLAAAGT